jgi:S-adenosylmethionine hydrolase
MGHAIPVRGTYAEAERGEVLALTGSTGYLEIAVRDGSAVEILGLEPGSQVVYDGT